jgi:hypothetical protein
MATNRANVLTGPVLIYTGTAGQVAADFIGYSNGASFSPSESENDIRSDNSTFPIKSISTEQELEITFTMMEVTLANLIKVTHGGSLSGGTASFGNSTNLEISLRLVGTDSAGGDRTIDVPYCRPTGGWEMSFMLGEAQEVEVTFKGLQPDDDAAVFTISDSVSSGVTLSTGVFAWVDGQLQYFVTSESGTSDTLTTITAGAATSSDTVEIHPASGHTITVDELGNIALAGADTTLALSGSDMLQVQYDGASSWDEIARVTFQ